MAKPHPHMRRITGKRRSSDSRRRPASTRALIAILAIFSSIASAFCKDISGLTYTYPAEHLKTGQSLGNQFCYVTLDGKTDLLADRGSVRYGLRESTNQQYYLLGWNLELVSLAGEAFSPVSTRMAPPYQETELRSGGHAIRKRFFVPFENGYLRSAHFVLSSDSGLRQVVLRSITTFPEGTQVEQADFRGHRFLLAHYADGGSAAIWGSGDVRSLTRRTGVGNSVEVAAEFDWSPRAHDKYALSFAYSLHGGEEWRNRLLNAIVDLGSGDPTTAEAHLFRIDKLFRDSTSGIERYLKSAQFSSPDQIVNRGYAWAKVNQLRMQQDYHWGAGFSNNPPSDVVVGRDSYWYLSGSSYYAQSWSRELLRLWSQQGLERSGKYIEYMTAASLPIFRDDYGLNINDNTPLLMIAAYRYYSLTGDKEYLYGVYPSLINSADYILAQREAGEHNRFGLVWCTSKETFVRGLCGWRNAIQGYNLSGAVTEVNAECYEALLKTAELAAALGDEANRIRLDSAAQELRRAIETRLRCSTPSNHFYLLTIDPDGKPVPNLTADLLFPVLCGVSDRATGQDISYALFNGDFWASTKEGAGGLRTVSPAEPEYRPRANAGNYGLLGGVWPNLALWAGKAAATVGLPELTLKGLKGTLLLTEPSDPAAYNVVPGEFPEYFNGDDLVQRGMPLSPFVPGIYIWDTLEGIMGIVPRPAGLEVNPALPTTWKWASVTDLHYRGLPLSVLAVAEEKTLYTTAHVESKWHQIVAPESLQRRYVYEGSPETVWMVIPSKKGRELVAASPVSTSGKLLERGTGRVLLVVSIGAGNVIRENIP